MADQSVEAATAAAEPTVNRPESDIPNPEPNQSDLPPRQLSFPTPLPISNPNPNITPATPLIPPPSVQPCLAAPSLRPETSSLPQFAPIHSNNPHLPQPPSYSGGLPPPGVSPISSTHLGQVPGQLSLSPSLPISVPPPSYGISGQVLRPPYMRTPNGYPGMPHTAPPPGTARFPPPYSHIVRPPYPLRPGTVAVIPPFPRPPLPVLRPSIAPPIVRPVLPIATLVEKPQTTVYIGHISPTVENDFMLSLLQLCGPVKSWKRPQDPTNGTLKGFGLYEFESPEGVLRALRLLSKLCIDGQELMLNVNQATRSYLQRYVANKMESSKIVNEADAESTKEDKGDATSDRENETVNSSVELSKPPTETANKEDSSTANKEDTDIVNFGLINDEDRQADQEALEKIKGMIEERVKNKPLPPPPARATTDGTTKSELEVPARSKDLEVDVYMTKDDAEGKIDNESDSKPSGELDKPEISSPDRDRKQDKWRDREREVKREKERELERYEREREQDRAKREKDREYRIREDERRYKAREKEWEAREKEKDHLRKREKEREKERAHERKRQVMAQERESDDGYSKKRKYRSDEEEKRKRQREKEADMADRLKEEEEISEAKRKAEEDLLKQQELKRLSEIPSNVGDGTVLSDELNQGFRESSVEQIPDSGVSDHVGEEIMQNGVSDEPSVASLPNTEVQNNTNASSRKMGFGLLGAGKKTVVPSVFNQDEEEESHKDKKMRPLVPIDYSTEEQLAVQLSASETPSSDLPAATESGNGVSGASHKEEKSDLEKERSRRSHDRHSQRDKDRNNNGSSRSRDEIRKENHSRDRDREYSHDKADKPEKQKLLDAKQLIDMIPKTKDELFSYEINWDTYDQNSLQERMKPWISKKITEFLGEEEPTLVDYIVSSTREHVKAAEMLDRLQGILDEEAEMFVLKMWRMLIFEIKRVDTGLALRSR